MRRVFAGLFLVALCLSTIGAASPSVAGAGGSGNDAPTLQAEIDAGFDGFFVPGRPTPVRVTLTATQLTSGRLVVRLGGNTAEAVDVEVTAGSSEDHWMLLDTPSGDSVQVEATLTADGDLRSTERQAISHDREIHLIGVLPSLGAGRTTDRIPLGLLDQELEVIDLAPELLDLGAEALAGLDSIALTPDDVASLSETHRRAVLGWLGSGGTLYVDGPAEPLLDWPDELQPGTPASGLGRVVATGGALAEGRWADVIVPAPNRSIVEDAEASQAVPGPDLFAELNGIDLGRDLPPLSRLLTFLGIYLVLVGPVVYFASRRRVMLRWVAIPAIAGLATAFLAVTGDGLGNDTTVSVVDIIETGPGASLATSRVLVSAEGGSRQVTAPEGWTAEIDDFFGFGTQIVQRRGADDVDFALQIPPGGVGYLTARGPVSFDGALEVAAASVDDGRVVGQVTNTTDVDLVDVAVFAGRAANVLVGDIAAGATVDFELDGTDQFRFGARPFAEAWAGVGFGGGGGGGGGGPTTTQVTEFPPMPPPDFGDIVSEQCDEFGNCEQCDVNGNCFSISVDMPVFCDDFGNCSDQGFGGCGSPADCNDRSVRPESLTAALYDRGSNVMAPGLVTAIGWTDRLSPQVDLGSGVGVTERRTAIVGRTVPVATGDRLFTSGVVRTLTSVGTDQNGNVAIVFRFDLPSSIDGRPVDATRLRIDVPEIFNGVRILGRAGETVVRDAEGEPIPPGRIEAVVPPDAIRDGTVFVAATLPFAPPQPGRELVIYEAPA